MKKEFEEPKFEKTEFEAVAYLCGGSSSNSNSNGKYYPDHPFHPNKPGHHKGC